MTADKWALIYLAVGVALQAYKWYRKESDIIRITNDIRSIVTTPIAALLLTMIVALMVIIWPYVLVNTVIHHRKKPPPPSIS